MTKAKIRAELRRSAVEDKHPFAHVAWDAYLLLQDWKMPKDYLIHEKDPEACRWFFLLVAEAMNG